MSKVHVAKIDALLRKIEELSEHATGFFAESAPPRRLLSNDYASWSFLGEAVAKYDDFVRHLLDKERWNKKYSERYTEEIARKWIGIYLSGSQSISLRNEVEKDLIDFIDYQNPHFVYVPFAGIQLSDEKINVSGLELIKCNEVLSNQIKGQFLHVIDRSTNSAEEKVLIKEDLGVRIDDLVSRSDFFLRINLNAEPIKAEELAIDRSTSLLVFLQSSLPLISRDYTKTKLSLLENYILPTRETIIVKSSLESVHFNSSKQFEMLKPVVGLEVVEQLRQCGLLSHVEAFYELDEPTEIEKKLAEAVGWLANAVSQNDKRNKALFLTIALEVFFGPPKNSGVSISNSVAESIAFLKETELAKRIRIKERVKYLYNKRSVVTHGGSASIYDSDISELLSYVYWSIEFIHTNKTSLKTIHNLRSQIDEIKFG